MFGAVWWALKHGMKQWVMSQSTHMYHDSLFLFCSFASQTWLHNLVGCRVLFLGMGVIIAGQCQPVSLLRFVLADGWPLDLGEYSSLWWEGGGYCLFDDSDVKAKALKLERIPQGQFSEVKKSFYNIFFQFFEWSIVGICLSLCPFLPLCHYTKWLLQVLQFVHLSYSYFSVMNMVLRHLSLLSFHLIAVIYPSER